LKEQPRDEGEGGPVERSPEARRKRAMLFQEAMPDRIRRHAGPGSRLFVMVRRVWTGAYYDGFIHAGNLAYMSILALFPFFILASAVFSAVGEPGQREASVTAVLAAVPPVVAKVIEPVARDVIVARTGWLLWVGAAFGLWTASSLIETIRDILHRAYGTPATRAFWQYRLGSSGVIFASVVLLLLALSAQVALSTVQEVFDHLFPRVSGLFQTLFWSQLVGAAILYFSIFLLFVTLTPSEYSGRRYPKWPGALLVTGWWMAVTVGLPRVLRNFFTYDLTYGSLAGVMIALFFFWLVGLGMVVGAELNAALAVTPEEDELRRSLNRSDDTNKANGRKDG
jgi:membrane protein